MLDLTYTELSSEQFVEQPAQTVRDLLRLVDAKVDETALTEAVANRQRYTSDQQLKQRLRDTIVPSVDHHELLQSRYIPADRLGLSVRNMFG